MFYLLVQRNWRATHNGIREELVSIEADSRQEAIERAIWFGCDMELRDPLGFGLIWYWHDNSTGAIPRLWDQPIENYSNWIVVYKNGNLRMSA